MRNPRMNRDPKGKDNRKSDIPILAAALINPLTGKNRANILSVARNRISEHPFGI